MYKIETIDFENKKYPQKLLKIDNYPKKIYAIGNISLLNANNNYVSIIGSRRCTEYGRNIAFKFSNDLSKKGVTVVSGLAKGIDAEAHIGAMREKGRTIAVLGGGLNRIYPEENEWLFHAIVENGGCIISEYEPQIEASSEKFPKRNRIVSALSDAILVVEAAYRSGTSITANIAKEQGKIIFAIPNNLNSINGVGTNKLLQEGAIIAIDYKDIMSKLKVSNNTSRNKNESKNKNKANNKEIDIKEEYKPIYNVLLTEPKNINELSKTLNIAIYSLNCILTLMQIEGIIKQLPGNEFAIN